MRTIKVFSRIYKSLLVNKKLVLLLDFVIEKLIMKNQNEKARIMPPVNYVRTLATLKFYNFFTGVLILVYKIEKKAYWGFHEKGTLS